HYLSAPLHASPPPYHPPSSLHDALPISGGLAAKLPILWRLLHLFLVHALIDHSGNLHVATKWKPTHSVCSVANFFLEQCKPWIEEEEEFFHSASKPPGGDIVSKLMKDHKDRQGQYQLPGLNPYGAPVYR